MPSIKSRSPTRLTPGEARRAAARLAEKLGFSETRAGELSIVVMELANNVLAHAQAGEILLLGWQTGAIHGVDIVALDKGPGIADLRHSLKDGYSTVGTPGNGLGAISRLTSGFDVYSNSSQGTALFARVLNKDKGAASDCNLDVGCLLAPIHGESVCGDGLWFRGRGRRCICIAVDGLGHGMGAVEATEAALRVFAEHCEKTPERIVHLLHLALRATRGAVVGIAEIDLDRKKLRYCGVGNISGSILADGRSQSLVSHNGTVGHVMTRTVELEYDFPSRSILVLHSDGLTSQWNLNKYAGLRNRHPGLIAGVLYRDFKRGRDDASILVIRERAEVEAA
ncbi:MAG: SpoIIE family protein phosphatase [Candidatus Korobacteraceae bacterium]